METKKTSINWFCSFVFLLGIAMLSCEKPPGEGGNATVQGKVWAKYYNNSFTTFIGEGYAQDKEVYIIYGDDVTYGERVRTNFDGTFEFTYLRKGHYTVYTYSKDSTLTSPSGDVPVLIEFDIADKDEILILPDIEIFD